MQTDASDWIGRYLAHLKSERRLPAYRVEPRATCGAGIFCVARQIGSDGTGQRAYPQLRCASVIAPGSTPQHLSAGVQLRGFSNT